MRYNGGLLEELPILRFVPDDLRSLVVRRFVPTSFQFGSVIAAEGAQPDALYVLVSGKARVLKRGVSGEEIPLNVLRAGESFGETELLDGSVRPTTVRASSDVLALRLDATEFHSLVDTHPDIRTYLELQLKHAKLQMFFRSMPAFNRLPPEAIAGVVLAELNPVILDSGQTVYRQGDAAGPLYLIEDGRVRVMQTSNGHPAHISTLGTGESFGLVSALRGIPRTTTVETVSPVRLLTLSRDTLTHLGSALPDFRAMLDERVAQYEFRTTTVPPDTGGPTTAPAPAEQIRSVEIDESEVSETREDAPFADGEYFVKRRRRLRVPFLRQIDEMDCGAACLAMVTRAFGRRVALARIRQLVNPGLDGTSLRSICRAGEELGLATRSVKSSRMNLDRMPLPAIVHWEEYHWVVLEHVSGRHVTVVDPALGRRRLMRDQFHQKWTGYAALFDYTPRLERAPESTRLFAWMWPLVRPHARLLVQGLGLAVVISALQMVLPVFTQIIVDRVLVEQDVSLLNVLITAMAATMGFIIVALLLQRYLVSFSAVRIDAAALDLLTTRLLALPMSYFAARRTGDIQRRLDGVRQVRDFLVQNGIVGITAIVQLVATVVLMAVYSPWLTAVFLTTAPLYALLMATASKVLRPVFMELEEGFSRYRSCQIDAIKGIETVKALGGESAFRGLLLNEFLGVAGKIFRSDFTAMTYEGASEAVTFLAVGLFLWAGTHQVLDGSLSIGGLIAFNTLVALSTVPLRNLLILWDNLQRCDVLINRLDDVFQHAPEQGHDRSALRPVHSLKGQVSLRGVGFRYGGPESPAILEGITLDVPSGKTIAIVGRSGSGKTTVGKCMSGLLEPTAGTILYDGLDLKTLNYRDLRRQIGIVLQESFLFADTIARNIAFGDEEPDEERVRWAAETANAHDFITQLPFGYETRIGETGLALSGGQRQRIAIARAIYHKPPILIFDEATSSLDTESERALQHNFETLLQGLTTFVIAHRLSTVQRADRIVVLERGRLAEQGTHDELIRRRGLYYYLASEQLGVAG